MDQFHIHSASMQLAALTCLQKRLSKISKCKGDSSISFYFGRPSLVSGVVLVEGGERVGVFDAAIGDVGAVASGDGGGGVDHGTIDDPLKTKITLDQRRSARNVGYLQILIMIRI